MLSGLQATHQDFHEQSNYADMVGSDLGHHWGANGRCRGQTSVSVSASYSRPFFIT